MENEQRVNKIANDQEELNRYKEYLEDSVNTIRKKQIRIMLIIILGIGLILSLVIFLFYAQYYFVVFSIIINFLFYITLFFLNIKEKYLWLIISIFLVLILYSIALGLNNAYSSENHIVFEEDGEDYVVLTIYKDQFLYAPINRETNVIKHEFTLTKMSNIKEFSKENIGRIK